MSDKTNINNGKKDQILKDTEVKRRNLQYMQLRDYLHGKATARQCIENIVDIEKIIFFDRRPNGR